MRNRGLPGDYLQLFKLPVIIPVSLTCFTAFFLFRPFIDHRILLVTAGVFLLAASASIINQVQEIPTDRLMGRTMDRPLPGGRISVSRALTLAMILFIAASFLLLYFGNLAALLTGWLNLLWYNAVYTPLKRKTAFAVVPGSLTGALPPVIGWVAAGGGFTDRTILLLALMFFMGQIPHFWLLIQKYGEQYVQAGIPSLIQQLTVRQIERLTYVWTVSAVFSALILCQFGLRIQPAIRLIILIVTILVLLFFSYIRFKPPRIYKRSQFIVLNTYFLFIMLMLITDRLIP